MNKIRMFLVILLLIIFSGNLFAGGVVYLVLGSDTAIWNGMNTARHNNYYNIDLYINRDRNTYKVMDPAFRAQFVDSYGTPLKMTWWMMAGNIFRYATNTNVPVPNIMTLYLMKKYHGNEVIANGDELSLHYHTFYWSDYDGDGKFWWNQAKTFLESKDDFDFTLAQFLLEEEVFPVSFRTGWHYMDNDWQHYLDEKILPYSLHNDYPAKKNYDTEPIDNIYDWSQAPPEWVPYNPSYANYQIPGNGKGWQVRSAHFWKTRVSDYMDSIFSAASKGIDQVACIWGHLPESNFLENIEITDSLAHKMEKRYPGVTFKYCTAVEAMQLWRKGNDFTPPTINLTENNNGNKVSFTVSTDENIFQQTPFIAVKDIYNNYKVVKTKRIGNNVWETEESFIKTDLVKIGVTLCDTMGNQSMKFIEYLPDDIYIDNLDSNFTLSSGNWNLSETTSWGTNSQTATIENGNIAYAEWEHIVTQSHYYNFFIQVPDFDNPADTINYIFYKNSLAIDTVSFHNNLTPNKWVHLFTKYLDENDRIKIKVLSNNNGNICADVLKISAIVRDKYLSINEEILNFNDVVINDTTNYQLNISNLGISDLNIFGIFSKDESLLKTIDFPIVIPSMESVQINLKFLFNELGSISDTLILLSDDKANLKLNIPINAEVRNYFEIVDNEDTTNYSEFGEWFTSVATAYKATSRYAFLKNGASAQFKTKLKETGLYNISFIIPETVNSTNHALYQINIENLIIDSIIVDQNNESGGWVSLGKYFLPENSEIKIKIIDIGGNTVGSVLRADAIRFDLLEKLTEISDRKNYKNKIEFRLEQNYPNPFNPSTVIKYSVPLVNSSRKSMMVSLKVYDVLGRDVVTLVDKEQYTGTYSVIFDATNLTSGLYIYRLYAGEYIATKKMIFLK